MNAVCELVKLQLHVTVLQPACAANEVVGLELQQFIRHERRHCPVHASPTIGFFAPFGTIIIRQELWIGRHFYDGVAVPGLRANEDQVSWLDAGAALTGFRNTMRLAAGPALAHHTGTSATGSGFNQAARQEPEQSLA